MCPEDKGPIGLDPLNVSTTSTLTATTIKLELVLLFFVTNGKFDLFLECCISDQMGSVQLNVHARVISRLET